MKEAYEAPQVQVIGLEVQGMLAQSPGSGVQDYNRQDEQNW